ncbi:MAG: MFS transporter [Succinivibrio sp.]|nr:MFS transporter [Succinivibrio sp.]
MLASFTNRSDKPLPTTIPERIAYGMGDFASCMLYVSTQAFLMYYYTEYVQVQIGMVATIMLVSRLFDGFSDILIGHFIERTRSPHGKARAWILRMIIPYILGCTLLFSVPEGWSDTAKLIYIFFSYNFAITVVYTAINMPYGAMMTMMTQDSYERSIIVIYRMALAAAGTAFVTAITMPLVRFFGNDTRAWTWTFLTIGCIGGAIFFITFYSCHERLGGAAEGSAPEEHDFKKAMRGLMHNNYWIMLTLAMVFVCCSDVMINTVNIYFCRFMLDDPELVGTYGMLMNLFRFGSMVVALPFLVKRIGKRNCLYIACAFIILALGLRLMLPHSVPAFYAFSILYGLAQGFTYTSLFAMIPDTVEYGEYLDGQRHEGYIYAGPSFGTKVAAGLGPVLVGFVLSLGGYVEGASEQSAEAMNYLLMASTVVPGVVLLLGVIALLRYRLDKEYPDIIRELGLRHAGKAAPGS